MHPKSSRHVAVLAACACALGLVAALLVFRPVDGRPAASSRHASSTPASSAPAEAPVVPFTTPTPRKSVRSARPAATPKPNRRTGQRLLTMVNRTGRTIWPAVAADPEHPIKATGWRLPPGGRVSVVLPDHWDARVWARTGCTTSGGRAHCVTGDCAGRFQCGSHWGALPATLAEFNLNAWRGMDFYDVSLVDGSAACPRGAPRTRTPRARGRCG